MKGIEEAARIKGSESRAAGGILCSSYHTFTICGVSLSHRPLLLVFNGGCAGQCVGYSEEDRPEGGFFLPKGYPNRGDTLVFVIHTNLSIYPF